MKYALFLSHLCAVLDLDVELAARLPPCAEAGLAARRLLAVRLRRGIALGVSLEVHSRRRMGLRSITDDIWHRWSGREPREGRHLTSFDDVIDARSGINASKIREPAAGGCSGESGSCARTDAPLMLGAPLTLGAPLMLGAPVTLAAPLTLGAPSRSSMGASCA